MNPELKQRLIKAFLMNKFPSTYQGAWLTSGNFENLGTAIEYMDEKVPFDLAQLNDNPQNFGAFFAILNKSLHFTNETPPRCTGLKEGEDFNFNMQLLGNFSFAMPPNLPNASYTPRKTQEFENKDVSIKFYDDDRQMRVSGNFEQLRRSAMTVLLNLAKNQIPSLPDVNDIRLEDITSAIKAREKLLETEEDQDAKEILENEITLLEDITQVAGLSVINIPKEDGSGDLHCILPVAAGGVTEKFSLMRGSEVVTQLANLYNDRNHIDFDSYLQHRDQFKLSTQGILKLPKHGKTIEVQREAIALNISRILGFTTTKSTMVEHNGQAALFVPFDKIQLMKEFAHGEIQHVILPSSYKKIRTIGDEYLHYSTIVPVGNQLHPDRTIEDFGKVMAFSYLCNDPDFIGMENQNKAIKDNQLLYIFDQVVMSDEKMELDTRLSLAPIGIIGKHSRHNQGRNRTIVEDSSFDAKFNSVAELLGRQEKINFMLDNMFFSHFSRISELQASIHAITIKGNRASPAEKEQLKALKTELKEVVALKNDVQKIKGVVNDRMQTMFKKFPTLNGQAMTSQVFLANQDTLRKSLILEKLVNKPMLFAEDGRPYKNPWTYRNKNKITAITLTQDNRAQLSFKKFDTDQMLAILRSAGIDTSLCRKRGETTLTIPIAELNKLHEKCMFPELGDFNPDHNARDYLDIARLKLNLSGYSEKSEVVIARIEKYKADLLKAEALKDGEVIKGKIDAMESALTALEQMRDSGSSKGMVKQVELNLQLDIQQNLRAIIANGMNPLQAPAIDVKIAAAFEAAVKLDRVDDFNHVLMAFASNGFRNVGKLDTYLQYVADAGLRATNYQNAKTASLEVYDKSDKLITALNKQPRSSDDLMRELMPSVHNSGEIVINVDSDEDEYNVNVGQFQKERQVQEHVNLSVDVDPRTPVLNKEKPPVEEDTGVKIKTF